MMEAELPYKAYRAFRGAWPSRLGFTNKEH
jgi:hypothetical protein